MVVCTPHHTIPSAEKKAWVMREHARFSWVGSHDSVSCFIAAVFNDYVRLTGCTHNKRPLTVGDDTPLIHLLSHSVDGEQGSDLLYTVIVDIVSVCVCVCVCLFCVCICVCM